MVGVPLGYIPCFNFRGVMNQLFPASFFGGKYLVLSVSFIAGSKINIAR